MTTNGHRPSGSPLSVLLAVGGFPMVNAGLRAVIEAEPDLRVVGEVEDRAALAAELERTSPDLVIAECLEREGCAAFGAIETIRALRPSAKVLALECRCGSEQFSLALKAGADGFLTREASPADIVTALRCIARGQTYVSPAIVTRMVNTYVLHTPSETPEDAYDSLSEREREILLLAATGHTNREIARDL
ncbi:MAG: LuxR C-terminal-related transcriptional regulator, partial [Candidatus Limnocylindrales bacterium]